MLTSKLQRYVDITRSLRENGPQTLNQISTFLNDIDNTLLREELNFLLKIEIIKQNTISQKYSIAVQGINLLVFFKIMPSKETVN